MSNKTLRQASPSTFRGLIFSLLVASLGLVGHCAFADESAAQKTKKVVKIPTYPLIEVETTEGTFVLELDGRKAPITVKNFVDYVQAGHYSGTIFHRVISDFMIQAGGYDADLAEKPTGETIPNESGNGLRNYRGTIAMARLNAPHSASAQFYINLVDNDALNPSEQRWGYTVFGKVHEGIEVIDKIAAIPTGSKGPFRSDVPQKTVTIKSAKLLPLK